MSRMLLRASSSLLILPISACAASHGLYAPQSAFSIDQDISDLHGEYAGKTSIPAYYQVQPENEQRRNEFIVGRLALYDLEYLRFIGRFRLSRAAQSSAMDAVTLGLGLATTLAGGERAKTVLGAVTTAFAGGRASYEKNFYDDKTAAALVTQMTAERKTALIPILAGLRARIEDYPLAKAIVDLNNYRFAGTVDGALEGVQKDAAAKDEKATEAVRSFSFTPDGSSARLRAWVFPPAGAAPGGRAPANQENFKQVRAAMAKLGLANISLGEFLDNPKYADERAAVLNEINAQ